MTLAMFSMSLSDAGSIFAEPVTNRILSLILIDVSVTSTCGFSSGQPSSSLYPLTVSGSFGHLSASPRIPSLSGSSVGQPSFGSGGRPSSFWSTHLSSASTMPSPSVSFGGGGGGGGSGVFTSILASAAHADSDSPPSPTTPMHSASAKRFILSPPGSRRGRRPREVLLVHGFGRDLLGFRIGRPRALADRPVPTARGPRAAAALSDKGDQATSRIFASPSAILRPTRVASAMIVTCGFTPIAVGNRLASAT